MALSQAVPLAQAPFRPKQVQKHTPRSYEDLWEFGCGDIISGYLTSVPLKSQ